MSEAAFDDIDLSDDWIEREQPPTLKFAHHGSMSGSVNILSDTTQKWNNVNEIVSRDLLTKQTKPLTSLFEPPPRILSNAVEGLSIVAEEQLDDHDDAEFDVEKIEDEDDVSWKDNEVANSDATTIRATTIRSADGLIPNFSFPRSSSSCTILPPLLKDTEIEEGIEEQLQMHHETESVRHEQPMQITRSVSESLALDALVTPKRNTHKSSASSVSPTKSPLKLFHAEQDTFTRDHTARMIGMLTAAPAPAMQTLDDKLKSDTLRSHESEISMMTVISDSGPERKRARTHEPKGSVTLQNFNDNADRLAAKLRAKSGGLGKGLPRVLEETKVVLGRRVSSAAERLDQQRRRERNPRSTNAPQSSGFESMTIPADQFMKEPAFGSRSSKSHFSDWESEANNESRQVSAATHQSARSDEELAAQSIKPGMMYDSVRQAWTQTPGRITAGNRPSSAPGQKSPENTHLRQASSISNPGSRKSPRIKNFPPAAMETLRHGDMIFDKDQQCWQHVNQMENTVDSFADLRSSQRPQESEQNNKTSQRQKSNSDYPDELDISSSASYMSSKADNDQRSNHDNRSDENAELNQSEISSCGSEVEGPSIVHHRLPPHIQHSNLAKVSQTLVRTPDERGVDELGDLTADMTMSQSTGYLVSAINKRYGAGPWEHMRNVDLSNSGLETLYGLARFFPSLISLDISGNLISTLEDLPHSLQRLNASRNKLSSHRTAFNSLTNLHWLDLSSNQFEDLDNFAPLSHLRHLNVANNVIECIDGLRNLQNLASFSAEGNMIAEVDFVDIQSHASLTELQFLNLSSNRIEKVIGIEFLRKLLDLDLSNNALCGFEVADMMPQMKVLNVSENRLTSFDLRPYSKLRVAYLDDNELSHVEIGRFKYIETFSMRRQGLQGVSIDLDKLREVKKLFLSGNELPNFHLGTVFHSLKYLELAGMKLKQLPYDFAQMAPNLRVLNLSNNDISSIAPLSNLSRLERLMLPNNKIGSIEQIVEVLVTLPRIKALDLRANPHTSRFYAPIHASHDIDYFANLDGLRNTATVMQQWLTEDEKYLPTLSSTMRRRRDAYENLIWSACRALRWQDGHMLDVEKLIGCDDFIASFDAESLMSDCP